MTFLKVNIGTQNCEHHVTSANNEYDNHELAINYKPIKLANLRVFQSNFPKSQGPKYYIVILMFFYHGVKVWIFRVRSIYTRSMRLLPFYIVYTSVRLKSHGPRITM